MARAIFFASIKTLRRRMTGLFALLTIAAVAGCSTADGLSFASRSADLGRSAQNGLKEIRLNTDLGASPVVLAAPKGFCFDQRSLERSDSGAFALLVRCDSLNPLERRSFFRRSGSGETALITATISDALETPPVADLDLILGAFSNAEVISKHPDSLLPLAKLDLPAAAVPGSSSTQWRGALALNDRLVALALYAPADSDYLGSAGAALLRDMARQSHARSRATTPVKTSALQPATGPESRPTTEPDTAAAAGTTLQTALRPKLRPSLPPA